jgi:hypothetical protein
MSSLCHRQRQTTLSNQGFERTPENGYLELTNSVLHHHCQVLTRFIKAHHCHLHPSTVIHLNL